MKANPADVAAFTGRIRVQAQRAKHAVSVMAHLQDAGVLGPLGHHHIGIC